MCIVAGGLLCGWTASANLVGFYELNNNYLDSSGSGYDGTIVNNTDGTPSEVYPGTDRFGAADNAMWWPALSGIPHAGADYIDTGSAASTPLYQMTGSMTVAAWVYLDPSLGWASGYQSTILTKLGGSGNRSWMFAVENQVTGGTLPSTQYSLRFRVSPEGSTLASAYDTTELPINQWVHVAAVYDAPAASIKLYVNGAPRTTGTTGTIPTSQFAGSSSIKIGNRDALVQQWWRGGIDEVRIYDEALTDAQVLALAQDTVTPLVFTLEPTDQTVVENQSATFTADFTGSPAFIQWYSNNVAIEGANNKTYTISPALLSMDGDQYKVQVTNTSYSITSSNATLNVTTDITKPTIVSVSGLGYSNQVIVTFSEPITLASAENPSNYAITNTLGSAVNVNAATLAPDALTVTLTTDPLTEMSNYVLVVNGIQDLAATPNTILPDSLAPFTHSTLVGHWQLNEGSGTTTADSGIGGFTGTLAGSPLPTWVPGYASPAALEFPGNANSRVDIGNPAPLQLTGALTLTAMAYPDTWTGGRLVTKSSGPGARGWALNTESTGVWALQIPYDSGTLIALETDPGTVPLGTWTHVAGVYDPNDPSGASMKVYTNGVLAAMRNDFFVPIQMYNPPTISVAIGARSDGSTRWDGKIDDVRIYARALSEAEIQALIPPPPLEFLQPVVSGDQLTLSWTGEGQLQAAPEVTGTYTNYTPTPTSPYTETIVPGENKFFRLISSPSK